MVRCYHQCGGGKSWLGRESALAESKHSPAGSWIISQECSCQPTSLIWFARQSICLLIRSVREWSGKVFRIIELPRTCLGKPIYDDGLYVRYKRKNWILTSCLQRNDWFWTLFLFLRFVLFLANSWLRKQDIFVEGWSYKNSVQKKS